MRHFKNFALDERTAELYRSGERLAVSGKAVELLIILSERPGELVTRQELRERLWPDNTFVDFDNNLNVAVRRLRQVLEDSATAPRYIETLPRRGLRFIPALVPPPAAPAARDRRTRAGRAVALAGLWLAAALAAAGEHWLPPQAASPRAIAIQGFRNLSGVAADDHVSEGLHAELAAVLTAPNPALRVVTGEDASALFAVRGTSRRDASGLYVTAELVDLRTNAYVWGESYLCPRADLFAIQRQVAAKIGERVAAALREPRGN